MTPNAFDSRVKTACMNANPPIKFPMLFKGFDSSQSTISETSATKFLSQSISGAMKGILDILHFSIVFPSKKSKSDVFDDHFTRLTFIFAKTIS
jgi:hypothetical protein